MDKAGVTSSPAVVNGRTVGVNTRRQSSLQQESVAFDQKQDQCIWRLFVCVCVCVCVRECVCVFAFFWSKLFSWFSLILCCFVLFVCLARFWGETCKKGKKNLNINCWKIKRSPVLVSTVSLMSLSLLLLNALQSLSPEGALLNVNSQKGATR